jgi:hypothetical protein
LFFSAHTKANLVGDVSPPAAVANTSSVVVFASIDGSIHSDIAIAAIVVVAVMVVVVAIVTHLAVGRERLLLRLRLIDGTIVFIITHRRRGTIVHCLPCLA